MRHAPRRLLSYAQCLNRSSIGNERHILRADNKLHKRSIHLTSCKLAAGGPGPGPNTTPDPTEQQDDGENAQGGRMKWGPTLFKMFESAATTLASIGILGLFGYSYTLYYKQSVLSKMKHAFEPGDPFLEMAQSAHRSATKLHLIPRAEQTLINAVISGDDQGHYFLIVGEKGQGKSSMILEAMNKINGDGVAMFEAHADIEIFRIRLGKALDFEYHEDNIGSLFSIRGPRDASALLDIERAFNKLEKVAIQRRAEKKKPLVLIINSMHLIRDDEDGRDLIELIQQRAEQWAASNLCTIVMNSDEYWIYERLKQYATRMELIPVTDLDKPMSLSALRSYRTALFDEHPSEAELGQVYDLVGGRLAFLIRVAKADNMLQACREICEKEKQWFLNQCWILGSDMDDDVMDQQKYAAAAMVMAKALVDLEQEMEKTYDPLVGHILPEIALHKARQIMTRADFIQDYDRINVFNISSDSMVRADSVPMQVAFRDVVNEPGFKEFLEKTLDRIADIESLGRTREVTIKDLWKGGKYLMKIEDEGGKVQRSVQFEAEPVFPVATGDEADDTKE